MANKINEIKILKSSKKEVSAKIAQEFSLERNNSLNSNRFESSGLWIADNGNGTYKNPILYLDYSDPDVLRVDDDYYMIASSFSCIPGLPILHSKDLVNWQLIGYALNRYPDDSFDSPQPGHGVWAPSLRYHNHQFFIYWGDPDSGIYLIRSKEIIGPWESPLLVLPGKGFIDPCPFWDDDGQAYLIHAWAASRAGINSLLTLHQMNTDGTEIDPFGKHVFDGNDNHPTIEGPKFYKRNGYYYISSPAGGVETGWQVVLRSKSIYGPYEEKIVLEQGTTPINGPHQGAWIETPSGQSWFIHFQDRGAYGRVVHLQPLTWQNDWPLMGRHNAKSNKQEPVLTYQKPDIAPQHPIREPLTNDEFNSDILGLQWQWQANPQMTWYALLPQTQYLRLFPQTLPPKGVNLWDAGNLLLQKFPSPDFTATTKVTFVPKGPGKRAGLVITGKDYACLSMTEKDDALILAHIVCRNADKGHDEQIIEEVKLTNNTVYLRVNVSSPDAQCEFSYSLDGQQFSRLGKTFDAVSGRWTGAKVGLFCMRTPESHASGHADFDWFRIE